VKSFVFSTGDAGTSFTANIAPIVANATPITIKISFTLGLCLSIVPDNFWFVQSSAILPTGLSPLVASLLAVLLLPAHIFWIYKTLFEKSKWGDFLLPYMRFIYPWRLSNPYGLFAVMTKSRPELVLEGRMDGKSWQEYEFNFKPGNVHKTPPIIAPFQPRMDWQMWFAGRAPQYLRFVRYDYTFSSYAELRKNGKWWERTFLGVYSPIFARDDF
jgi:hypothetical protein